MSYITIENAIVTFSATGKPVPKDKDKDISNVNMRYQLKMWVSPEQAAILDAAIMERISAAPADKQQSLKYNAQQFLRVANGSTAKPRTDVPEDYRRVNVSSVASLSIVDVDGVPYPAGYDLPTGSKLRLALDFFGWTDPKTGDGLSWTLIGAQVMELGNGTGKARAANPFATVEAQSIPANPFDTDKNGAAAASDFKW